MVIAFWSNVKGKGGVTSNLACISVQAALEGRDSILFENHFNIHSMGDILEGAAKNHYLKEEYSYQRRGLEPLIRQFQCGYAVGNIKESYSVSYLQKGISYLPQSQWMNQELFDYEFCQVIRPMLKELKKVAGTIYIDTSPEDLLSTRSILEEADVIVVNLNQDPHVVDHYFKNYHSYMEKSIFLLSHYEEESRFNRKLIFKKYPVGKEKIAVIPYFAPFKEAVGEGRVIRFFEENKKGSRKKESTYFFEEVKEASDMIWEFAKGREKKD